MGSDFNNLSSDDEFKAFRNENDFVVFGRKPFGFDFGVNARNQNGKVGLHGGGAHGYGRNVVAVSETVEGEGNGRSERAVFRFAGSKFDVKDCFFHNVFGVLERNVVVCAYVTAVFVGCHSRNDAYNVAARIHFVEARQFCGEVMTFRKAAYGVIQNGRYVVAVHSVRSRDRENDFCFFDDIS